jgi:pimeloyl-ACP methyl ester carboxylesterase
MLTLAGVAAVLGAAALYTRAASAKIRRRHQPRGRFVPTQFARLHTLDEGEGEPIVLLHGNAVTAEDWRNAGVFGAAAKHNRAIAPDRPGYGHSERPRTHVWTPKLQADAIAELLRELDAAPALVVAHSLATQVALRLALDHPALVKGLVLVSGYYFPSLRPDVLMASPAASPVLGDLIRRTFGPLIGKAAAGPILKAMFSPARVPSAYEREIYETSLLPLQMRACTADGSYMLREASRLQKRLSELTVRVAILAGADDRIVDPKAQSQRLADALSGAQCNVLPGVGHMLHHQNSDAVLNAIRALDTRATPTPPLPAQAPALAVDA